MPSAHVFKYNLFFQLLSISLSLVACEDVCPKLSSLEEGRMY